MAIPDKPESRAEMYLNKIASGSGTIPEKPESRLEQYLDAIANNGGGGGSGGGVEVVYLTLMSNNDKGYIIHNNFPYVNENEETIMPTPTDGDVFPGWPVVMGFPKFGDGAVLILLDSLIDGATVDYSVTPVITGGVELIQGGLKLTGDGTIAFNGTLDE
jgi:hypothetical protein